jgi:hypothetical protein
MSEQKNLFELLKPEAKRNLVRNIVKYPNSVNNIIKKLKSLYLKSDLTIETVSDLYTFTNIDYPDSKAQTIWCTNIFEPYEK